MNSILGCEEAYINLMNQVKSDSDAVWSKNKSKLFQGQNLLRTIAGTLVAIPPELIATVEQIIKLPFLALSTLCLEAPLAATGFALRIAKLERHRNKLNQVRNKIPGYRNLAQCTSKTLRLSLGTFSTLSVGLFVSTQANYWIHKKLSLIQTSKPQQSTENLPQLKLNQTIYQIKTFDRSGLNQAKLPANSSEGNKTTLLNQTIQNLKKTNENQVIQNKKQAQKISELTKKIEELTAANEELSKARDLDNRELNLAFEAIEKTRELSLDYKMQRFNNHSEMRKFNSKMKTLESQLGQEKTKSQSLLLIFTMMMINKRRQDSESDLDLKETLAIFEQIEKDMHRRSLELDAIDASDSEVERNRKISSEGLEYNMELNQ